MIVKDILVPWKPIEDLPDTMYVEAVYDDYEGFRIILRGEAIHSKMLRVMFKNNLSYRNIGENFHSLKVSPSTNKEVLGKVFYIVENSSYIDYFNEMTQGIYIHWETKHYAIYTFPDCIDVISVTPPTVEWLD